MRNLARAVAFGVALPVFVFAGSAGAETALPTVCAVLLVPTDEPIPANAPALVARLGPSANAVIETTTVTSDPPWPGSLTVVDDDRHPAAKLIVPSQALPAGTELTIELGLDCVHLKGTAKATFTPSDSSPLPTTIGVPKGAAKLEPSAELVKFLPVTMFEAKIAEGVYPLAAYGEIRRESDGLLPVPIENVPTSVLCADDERSDKTIPVELRAHVAGATSDPTPIVVDVAVTCRPIASPPPPSPAPSVDAGPDTETTVRDDAGGCALAPNAPASVWATFVIGALVVVATRRRRVIRTPDASASRRSDFRCSTRRS